MIADRALGKALIDADQIFQKAENQTIEQFVAARGWPAFREREAIILRDLLGKYPRDSIIACGSGIIESEESRAILIEARKAVPIINLVRERDAVLEHLSNLKAADLLPEYGEEEEQLIRRREPLYRQCASHIFVNLTCYEREADPVAEGSSRRNKTTSVYPLKFKQVGESFLRLIRHILGDARRPHSRPVSRPVSRPSSPSGGVSSFASHPRGSISHLLGSHGPGPDHGGDRYSPSASSPHTLPSTPVATLQCPSLPRKADPTSRASLLTRRTTAISLTFPDLTQVPPSTIRAIVQGVDAVEVRVDMLACLRPASQVIRSSQPLAEPKIDLYEVAMQLELLRKAAPGLPILFTLRSDREGGCFFDDRNRNQRHMSSPYSQGLYFDILQIAIATGVELLDVEMGWDPELTRRFIEKRDRTKIVVSYHDLKGALQWDTEVPRKLYQRAAREFGSGVHLVELVGTASRSHIEQNSHLTSFAAKVNSEAAADRSLSSPPLMALNMHLAGRSSRPFNDVLSFISHPALPRTAGPGQMSLKDTMETLVRFGIYQDCHFHILTLDTESELVKRALQISFSEFGLPYHVKTWYLTDTLEGYLQRNKEGREGALEWQGESVDDRSSGLFLGSCHLADQQRHLYDLMERRYSTHLTLSARVVRAVDVMARQDISQSLLGTEHGRRVPNALGDVRGPLIGCHTLPSSIYRVLSAHTAPINAPGIYASALVVILKPSTASAQEKTAIEIAARSSLFAMAKLGFGEVYVLEEEKGHLDDVISEVLYLVRHSRNDVLDEVASEHGSTETKRCQFTSIDVHQLGEPEAKSHGPDSIRKPRAIVIVGGSEEKQETTMQSLWMPKTENGGSVDGLSLPRETWDTLFGGTVLRVPSVSSNAFGQQVVQRGQEVEAGVTWERGGWIHVAPWVLDRDRVHKRVVEAWARRGAPVQSMQEGWQA